MPSVGSIARFAAVALLGFSLLVLSRPLLGEAYAKGFRSVANATASALGVADIVHFRPPVWDASFEREMTRRARVVSRPDIRRPGVDTHLFLGREGLVWKRPFKAWSVGFVPLAVVLALSLASPYSLARRALLATLSGLFVQSQALFVTVLQVLEAARQRDLRAPTLFRNPPKPLLELEGIGAELLELGLALGSDATAYYLVPAGLWLLALLVIERSGLSRPRARAAGSARGPSTVTARSLGRSPSPG